MQRSQNPYTLYLAAEGIVRYYVIQLQSVEMATRLTNT